MAFLTSNLALFTSTMTYLTSILA